MAENIGSGTVESECEKGVRLFVCVMVVFCAVLFSDFLHFSFSIFLRIVKYGNASG